MKHITTDELRQIPFEGLILQGCAGDPQEWVSGINELLTQEGILLNGDTFKDVFIFEHDGLTNMLFNMEDVNINIGKLAMWRIANHDTFGGTWLSDYLPNKFGVELAEQEAGREDGVIDGDEHNADETPPAAAVEEITARPFRAYIENAHNAWLGGFTMPLPATQEDLRPFLEKIEIKGSGDVKVWDVLSDIDDLRDAVTETVNQSMTPDTLNELNYLAAKITAMQPAEYETFAAALEAKRHCGSVAELINLTENLDRFDIQPAFDAEHYGEFLIEAAKDETSAVFDRLEHSDDPDERAFAQYILRLEAYADEAAYGRGVAQEENGVFTDQGYLTEKDGFKEVYRGPEDIPAEHRILPPAAQAQEKTAIEAPQVIPPGIHSDEMLGRYLYDNKMLSEKDMQDATIRLNITHYPEDCYRMLGKRHREAANGSYTKDGYAESCPAQKPSVLEQIAAARAERAAAPEKPTPEKAHKPRGPEL